MSPAAFRLLAPVLAIALTSCGSPVPEGQVLAIIDGKDVTRRDLAGEGLVEKGQLAGTLRDLIDRCLLAAAASRPTG